MSKQNLWILGIAVVAGVAAALMSITYISTARQELVRTEMKVKIVVAMKDLDANHALDPMTDLKIDEIDAVANRSIVDSCVRATERDALRGRRLAVPVLAQTPLFWSHLASTTQLTLKTGMRALSLQVDSANQFGGLLVPGDRVDIMVSRRIPKESSPSSAPPAMPALTGNQSVDMGTIMAQMMNRMDPYSVDNFAEWGAELVLEDVT